MKHAIAIATLLAGIAGIAQAGPLDRLFGEAPPKKFAVKALLTHKTNDTKTGWKAEKRETLHLDCDMTVALKCTNGETLDANSIISVIRDPKDKEKRYTLDIQPKVRPSSEHFIFGPYPMPALIEGINVSRDMNNKGSVYTLVVQITVHPEKP